MPDLDTKRAIAEIRSSAGIKSNGFDRSKEAFGINAGTSIVDVINQVMRNSEYIRKQITDNKIDVKSASDSDIENYAIRSDKTIKWYKIVPIVEISKFDLARDTYSKHIRYDVVVHEFHNTKYQNAIISVPSSALKEYHYMFTGKNDSILSFDLNFDTMFYSLITADSNKLLETVVDTNKEDTTPTKAQLQKADVGVQDHMIKNVSSQMDMAASQGGVLDAKGQAVNDFYKITMSNSQDMISVKLKIIGDSELIKQDDIFFNSMNSPKVAGAVIDKNGSLIFDRAEMHSLLTFNSPVDFDPVTGLSLKQNITSVFSGMYRILTVENEFRSGQFTQTLDLVRMFRQEKYDTASASNSSNDQRKDAPKSIADTKKQAQGSNPLKEETKKKNLLSKELANIRPPKIDLLEGQPIRTELQKLKDLKKIKPITIDQR
jgi:hypothetical protein